MKFDSLANVQTLGGAAAVALHQAKVEAGAKDSLKEHPGKAVTVLALGLPRLRTRLEETGLLEMLEEATAAVRFQYDRGAEQCESPIERSMLAALLTGHWMGFNVAPPPVHIARDKEEQMPNAEVVIIPQMAFLRFRMDFGVVLRVGGQHKILCVECDGHAFHQDYMREKRRRDYLEAFGIPTFQFTGSELHEDPIACADKVVLHACQLKEAMQ